MTPDQCTAFILGNTELLSPPLVPEIKLHLAHEAIPIWQKTEDELGAIGLPPPFWAFAWAGGQALARYILDRPEIIRGRRVLDMASGSGLVAIAASKAGASEVLAADIDAFAVAAIAINAAANDAHITVTADNLLTKACEACDVLLIGDLFYEKVLATSVFAWCKDAQTRGIAVLIGDPGRSYLPKDRLEKLAEYRVPVSRDLEDAEIKNSAVWTLRG